VERYTRIEMNNSQSFKFLDSGEALGSWSMSDEDSIRTYMDHTVLTTTPCFRPEFYNQGRTINYPLLEANILTTPISQEPPPVLVGEVANPPIISAISNDALDFLPNSLSPRYV
jgi:hypothetical protein